jgi:hypothetical protein
MAKFNISVELDWIEEDGTLDNELKDIITQKVVDSVIKNVTEQVNCQVTNKVNERLCNFDDVISEKLNGMMEEFFNTPKNITDSYGDIIKKNVTVSQMLKDACDNFIEQSVDEYGKPSTGYNRKYNTRVDYIVSKSIDTNMTCAINSAVTAVTKNLKEKISSAIKDQLGEKLGELTGIKDIIDKL